MLFNSFAFLGSFAVLVIVYYAIPHRFRWVLLVAASLYFYATFNLNYVLLLLAAALVAYFVGVGIGASQQSGRKKTLLLLGVLASLAPLFVFKYFDFFAQSFDDLLQNSFATSGASFSTRLGLLLPAGLSFY